MCDQRKVCEMSLYVWIQDGLRTGVAEWRPVLVQRIHQLFTKEPEIWRRIKMMFDSNDLTGTVRLPINRMFKDWFKINVQS